MARINISQILMKRGNTAAAGNYIGPLGELVVDTGLRTIRVQDGVTAGGMAVLATLAGYNQLSANIANLQTTVSTISGLDTGFVSNINTLLSNTVTQQTQINTIGANLAAFQTYANTHFGISNYGNAQVAAYLTANPQGGNYSDANVVALLGNYSNAIQWTGGSQVYEDTVLVAQGAVAVALTSPGETTITAGTNTWTFGKDNTLTVPGTVVTQYGNIEAGTIGPGITIMANVDAGQYFNGLFVGNTTNRRQHYVEVDQGEVLLGVTNLGTNQLNIWTFNDDASISAPGDINLNGSINFTAGPAGAITGASLVSAQEFYSSGNVTVGGNLIINGSAATIATSNLIIDDNIIYMANANPANSLDIGFAGHFNNGTYQHTGLVRQASTGQWKLFSNIVPEPGNTLNFTNAVYDAIQVGNITSPTVTDLYANAGVQSNSIAGANAAIVTANTAMKGYVDAVTTAWTSNAASQAGLITTLQSNAGVQADAIAGANAAIVTANTAMKGYVDAVSTDLYANASVQSNSIAGANAAIVTANTAMKGYVDAVSTDLYANASVQSNSIAGANAAIVTANTAMKSYVDAVTTAWTANVSVQSNSIAGANAAIVTANTAMKSYVDAVTTAWTAANTIQAGQITGANAAIITANSAVVSYVNTLTNSLATGANANVLAYLTPGFTVSGNITAGNISNVNIVSANSVRLTSNLTVSGTGTIGGNLYVYGNLQVSGTTTTVNQATLSITDKIITVSNGSTSGSQANGAGLSVAGANANLYYTSIGDQWNSNKPFYAPGIYDGATRVVSTSSGAGNLTISGTGINLTAVGPGAVTTGSATAIPVITTDAYGRIANITTAAVSSTLNTAGNTGTGTVSLTSQSLTIAGTNGLTATASGQTITLTDNLWPAANANLGTATTNITALQANLGGYYVWANANVAGLSSQITGANAAIVTANSAVVSYVNTLNSSIASNVAGANAAIVTANTALKGYVDAGNTTQSNQINSINANIGSYYTWANANVAGLQTSVTSLATTQSNQINSINANIGSYYTWANANVAGLQTSVTSLATNANTNTAAYLAAGISTNVTTTGNISATNVTVNGQPTTYGYVNGSYLFAYNNADQASVGQNGAVNFQVTSSSNGSLITKTSNSQITLKAGNTYALKAVIGRLTSSSSWAQFRWYDVTNGAYVGAEGFSEAVTSSATGVGSTLVPTAYVTPNVNTTYELRQTTANTVTVSAYASMEVTQVNPAIAVQATATGTINNQYASITNSTDISITNGVAKDVTFDTVTASSGIPYSTSTGVFTLTSGVTYRFTGELSFAGYTGYALFTLVDATTNTPINGQIATCPSYNSGFAEANNNTYDAIYTPSTNQTVKFRITGSSFTGTGVIRGGYFGRINVQQINNAFALNALATMSVTGNVTVGGNLNVTGTSTSLVTKASGLVNQNVYVTLGNLKVRMAGLGGLQVATVSGTYTVYGSGIYSAGGVGYSYIDGGTPLTITTTPAYLKSGLNFSGSGNTDTWNIMDTGNSIAWRITLIVGQSYNNNLISIERLL